MRTHALLVGIVVAVTVALVGSAGPAAAAPAASPPSGAIAGHVTGADGAPLADVTVAVTSLNPEAGAVSTSVRTDATGAYRVTVPSLTYSVCFTPADDSGAAVTGYVPQCWKDEPGGRSRPVRVAAGADTAGIDATLAIGASVTGTVTGAGGVPLPDVSVTLSSADGPSDVVWDPHQAVPLGSATTGDDGTFVARGLYPGTYTVCAEARSSTTGSPTGYLPRCWNVRGAAMATPLALRSGRQRAGIDIALRPALAVSGTVRSKTGAPLAGVDVTVDDRDATTGADGSYEIDHLPPGTYTACFYLSSYLPACWKSATPENPTKIRLTTAPVSGVDATLAPRKQGGVGGTVKDNAGHPLGGVSVSVRPVDGGGGGGGATTAADGTWTSTGLAPGRYAVCFDAGSGTTGGTSPTSYRSQCWKGVGGSGTPTPVTVRAGTVTAHVDAHLVPGFGAIRGTVRDTAGRALGGVFVIATMNGGPVETSTADDGSYVLNALPPGSWSVCFRAQEPTGAGPYGVTSQCWKGVPDDGTTPTPVTVTDRRVTTVSPRLPVGGAVAGTVTDVHGAPVAGAGVVVTLDHGFASYATTAWDGTFSVPSLRPGSYTVCFDGRSSRGDSPLGYLSACHGSSANPQAPVDVKAGRATTVDQVLAPAGALTGTVVDSASGAPIDDVGVTVYDADGTAVGGTATYSDGTWTVTNLPTGSYSVCFTGLDGVVASPTGYLKDWQNGCYLDRPAGTYAGDAAVTAGSTTQLSTEALDRTAS